MEPISEIVQLNTTNQLRISISEFKGFKRLDVRHYFGDGLPGCEWKPTQKGINVSIDVISDFRKALDKVFSRLVSLQDSGEFKGDEARGDRGKG